MHIILRYKSRFKFCSTWLNFKPVSAIFPDLQVTHWMRRHLTYFQWFCGLKIFYLLWATLHVKNGTQKYDDCFVITEETQYRKKGDDTGSQSTSPRGTSQKNGGGDHVSLRPSNLHHSVSSRRRVIRMLFVIVLEYFVCWTPLYVCSTWKIIHYQSIHERVSNLAWSMMLLLAYVSSFVHPVTYCFMNKNFRKGFVSVFKCFLQKRLSSNTEMSNLTANSSPTVRFQTTEYTRVQSVEWSVIISHRITYGVLDYFGLRLVQ